MAPDGTEVHDRIRKGLFPQERTGSASNRRPEGTRPGGTGGHDRL